MKRRMSDLIKKLKKKRRADKSELLKVETMLNTFDFTSKNDNDSEDDKDDLAASELLVLMLHDLVALSADIHKRIDTGYLDKTIGSIAKLFLSSLKKRSFDMAEQEAGALLLILLIRYRLSYLPAAFLKSYMPVFGKYVNAWKRLLYSYHLNETLISIYKFRQINCLTDLSKIIEGIDHLIAKGNEPLLSGYSYEEFGQLYAIFLELKNKRAQKLQEFDRDNELSKKYENKTASLESEYHDLLEILLRNNRALKKPEHRKLFNALDSFVNDIEEEHVSYLKKKIGEEAEKMPVADLMEATLGKERMRDIYPSQNNGDDPPKQSETEND